MTSNSSEYLIYGLQFSGYLYKGATKVTEVGTVRRIERTSKQPLKVTVYL